MQRSTTLPYYFLYILLILNPVYSFSQAFEEMTMPNNFNITGQNRGISIGDFNGDGLEDIYVSSLSGPNLLYKNLGNFQFEEVGALYGVNNRQSTNCSVWFDIDNDGDQDLYIANTFYPNTLYRNDGELFTDVTFEYGVGSIGNAKSLHVADYDNDGYLDIYVAQFFDQNILFKNDRGKGFLDATAASGIDDTGRSLGAIFVDYDLDGDQDIYQTRDGIDQNLLFENNGDGTFSEISAELGLDYTGMGMGTDVADLNGDRYPDIYLTNLYENKLYHSKEGQGFDEVSTVSGVDDIGMGWSTFFFDCNNDGLQDIYLANDSYFGVNGISPIPNRLFINNGNNSFYFLSQLGREQNTYGSYGAATADFDLDGKIDIAIANHGAEDGNQLFKNTSPDRNYIGIKLKGQQSNADGVGARVELYMGDKVKVDFVNAGSGYASQNSKRLHFGLGTTTAIDSLLVFWPSGIRQKVTDLAINQLHQITEEIATITTGAAVWTEPAFPTQFDDVKVFFDASAGNAALKGFTGSVFAHTGVITSRSSNENDWQHVVGNWGTFDSRVIMTKESEDLYSISYNIQDFYGIAAGEEVRKMAFVFRDVGGNIVGRAEDGSDIFTEVFPPTDSLFIALSSPLPGTIISAGDDLLVNLRTSKAAKISILDNGFELYSDSTDHVEFDIQQPSGGNHDLFISAISGEDTVVLESNYFVVGSIPSLDPPANARDGLNYTDTTYIFQLYAPEKEHVFLLCSANEYTLDASFRMNPSVDGTRFWIEVPKSQFTQETNTYQYMVDGSIIIADPYSKVVLDPAHDPFLSQSVMAELPGYPENATGIVSVFDLEPPTFDWQNGDFQPAKNADLVIYEVLLRDFLHDHSYQSLIDTLDYFEKLGVNAIELMPIQEFEGNISWGYNPSFHLAVDKYYGSRDELKTFIDEAHERGIAVILDIVYNHTFSQGPLAQLYWDATNFRPSEDNPWLNVTPRHPFNVGYDFNHESQATKNWVKRGLEQWIEEYHFDGFRFDLSKGLTQTLSGNNADAMSQYDPSRIAILKDYADFIWSLDEDAYVIMEHFAVNQEEKELADYGMMLWGNNNHQFGEAAMGYRSELRYADYTVKGWNNPHLVAYMESHDEERIMYKVPIYGNSEGAYSTKEFETAIDRMKAATAIFYSIPGPKMLWQFGELGYDFSINRCPDGTINPDCRLAERPIRWDYLQDAKREELRAVTAAMIHLKTQYPTFSTTDFTFDDSHIFQKIVRLNHPDMDALCMANFRVVNGGLIPRFPSTGTWYEYFSGDSLEVSNPNQMIFFGPGEYRIYTSKRIQPPGGFLTDIDDLKNTTLMAVYPNPVKRGKELVIETTNINGKTSVELISLQGTQILVNTRRLGEKVVGDIPKEIAAGLYLLRVRTGEQVVVRKVEIW